MKINPVSTSHINNRQNTSFKSTAELYKGCYECYNTSGFFWRFDIRSTIQYLERFYKNTPLVNIISHACAEGQQTFSIKFLLMSMLGKQVDKYKIYGRDFDAQNILAAKNGVYTISSDEMARMEQECGLDLYKYITILYEDSNGICIKVKDYIRDQIQFKQADILKDDDIPADNTFLLTDNMWPYLPSNKQTFLAEKLADTLSPSSHIKLGEFDISNNIHHLLRNKGFEHTEVFEIMKKPKKSVVGLINPIDYRLRVT